jgi:hypothetical protein
MRSRFAFVLPVFAILAVTLACASQAVPTATPASADTSVPPTVEPVVQSTATPEPPGPCDNILFPFIPGNQWIYQSKSDDGSQPSKIGLTVDKVENAKATINALDMSTGVITQTVAECENGAIKNYPALTQKMLIGSAAAGNFTLDYVSGVFAPAEAAFTDNNWLYQWTSDFIASGSLQVDDEGSPMQIVLQASPVHFDWKTAGAGDAAFESITVPAGTFEKALKVQRQALIDISIAAEGASVKGKLILQTTQWYAPATGLLKTQIDSGNITYLGMTFPVELKNTVELVEFRHGQ